MESMGYITCCHIVLIVMYCTVHMIIVLVVLDVHHTITVLGTNEVVDTLGVNENESKEDLTFEIYFSLNHLNLIQILDISLHVISNENG